MLLFTATLAGEAKGFSLAGVTTKSWLALAYLILFGSVVVFTAYNWLLEHYSPTLVATHTYVNPVVAVLLGWAYGGERSTLRVALRQRWWLERSSWWTAARQDASLGLIP